MENRKNFFSNDLNTERATETLNSIITKCNLGELLWIFRTITYDMVSYYSKATHSPIYDDKSGYSELNKEQANYFQNQIRTVTDLFGQSIIKKREFNQDYLKQYEFAGSYLITINNLKKEIERLENEISENNE